MIKISVIIPVYNTQEYLPKCIESVLSQPFENFEILLINDGSTDNSGAICDSYAMSDSRIRVLHKENGGVSSARNLGIEKAEGEYTIHLDSDDYISTNMLEEMYNKATLDNCDILIADYYSDINGNIKLYEQRLRNTNSNTIIKQLLEGELHGSVCNKLIKSSLYKDGNVTFNQDIDYCEDLLFNIECFLLNPKVSKIDKAFLYYVQRDGSAIRTYNSKIFSGLFRLIDKLQQLLDSSYEESLNHFKLVAKRKMIISNLFSSREIRNKYKEANKYILKNKFFTFPMKMSIYLSVNGFYPIVNMLLRIKRNVK